ncbi:MAG: DNA primase [Bacillota bacterium]
MIQMGGFIPEELIEVVRFKIDILEIISESVRLEKKGRNYIGNCPFHQDKDPSFTVSPEKQIFYCFGCHAGGNIFKFLMLRDNLEFPEAVRALAERAGISIPESAGRQEARVRQESRAREINAEAVAYFQRCLENYPEAGNYLTRRGISSAVKDTFSLGYAPNSWDGLLKHLGTRGYKARELVEAGLVSDGDKRVYDRFRGRIMFPIRDERGRVVGFGGRVLDSSHPKYLNSPETSVFNKSRVLFGLDLAKRGILEKGCAVVMEGYLDVITAHRCGINNAVASLGTSLTRDQGRLLLKFTKNVFIAYDADTAGVAATVRGLDLLQELGCRVKVVNIPPGEDPDDFIRNNGPEGWQTLLNNAEQLLEFKIRQAALRPDSSAGGKSAILDAVLPNLALITDEVERVDAIQLVASRLHTTWNAVAGELKRFLIKNRKNWPNPDNTVKSMHNIFVNRGDADPRFKAERGLLHLIMENPDLAEAVQRKLGPGFFKYPGCNRIFKLLLNKMEQQQERLDDLYHHLSEEDQQLLTSVLTETIPGDNPVEILTGYMNTIMNWQRKDSREELMNQLAEAERAGDWDLVYKLQRLLQQTY